jgi:outer membrane protein W
MFKRILLGTLFAVICCAGMASAVTFEVTPFVGARTTGEFDDIVTPLIREVEIDGGTSFGLTFGLELTDNWQIELLYSTQTSDFTASPAKGPVLSLGDIDTTVIHVGGLYQFRDSSDELRPFFSFGLGGTIFDPEEFNEDDTKLSMSLGGGLKYMFNDRFGLRFQGRFISSEINDEDELYCDPFACYVVEDSNFLYQFEVAVGLAIRFGN